MPFTRELAAQVARTPSGQVAVYPVVRTVQTDGICTEVVAPCPDLSDEHALAAQQVALRIAEQPRRRRACSRSSCSTPPTACWSTSWRCGRTTPGTGRIDGAVTSQFENHLRAVLDLPLGSPQARSQHTVMVNVLGWTAHRPVRGLRHVLARDPGLQVHLYGKEVRPGRKLGHVTVCGDDLAALLARAHHAADYLTGVIDQ